MYIAEKEKTPLSANPLVYISTLFKKKTAKFMTTLIVAMNLIIILADIWGFKEAKFDG